MNFPQIKDIDHLNLKRYPLVHDPSLKAWNAADEYLVAQLQQLEINKESQILIINDQFGALCCALSEFQPDYWTDSYLSQQATIRNLKNNHLDHNLKPINQCTNILKPTIKYNLLIIRIPKHNSLLEFQLQSVRQHLCQDAVVIAAGMTKEIHNSQLKIFEKFIGSTQTSLAKKKARLIFSKLDPEIKPMPTSSLLENNSKSYCLQTPSITIFGYPGVFARDSLDQGARVMLQHLPQLEASKKVMDLGCGNGILGSVMAKQNPGIEVSFSDESYLAIQSAKKTFHHNITQSQYRGAPNFYVTNVLDDVNENDFDVILCNPPFHQQNSQTLSIAKKMFSDAAQKLHSEGELRVVANRHLPYAKLLKNYFARVSSISKDPKFIVWQAQKPLQKNAY